MNVSYRLALGVEFSFAMEANGIDTEIVEQAHLSRSVPRRREFFVAIRGFRGHKLKFLSRF